MRFYYDKIHTKRFMAFIFSIAFTFMLMINIVPAYSGQGTVIDSIVEAVQSYLEQDLELIATAVVDFLCDGFSPSYDLYVKLSDPDAYTQYNIAQGVGNAAGLNVEITSAGYRSNTIIGTIFTFCQNIGVVLSTVLTLFFLMACMLGRAEYIRDNPLSIFVKYAVTLVLIYLSWDIVFYIMDLLGDIWTEFVMQSTTLNGTESLSYTHFSNKIMISVKDNQPISILGMNISEAAASIGSTIVLSAVDKCLFWFLGLFLLWKLFKQFLRLYVEIAERYFVLTFLTLFFPAVIPSIISNSTSNVMSSYQRMFVCQAFLLLSNGIFMKIFVYVLMKGGWTAGITNYICGLAFIKCCMKLDSYMFSMGLNVAQTGGGMLDSIGGAFNTIGNTIRSFGMADRIVANHGKSLMTQGAETNNKTLYSKGANLSGGIVGGISGSRKQVTDSQFSNAVAHTPTTATTRSGLTYHTGGTETGLNAVANKINIPSTSVASALNKGGISADQVHSVKQLNGTKQFSNQAGTRFALRDASGNNLAVIDGSNVYTYKGQQEALAKYNKNELTPNFVDKSIFSNNDIDINSDINADIIRQGSSETTFGVQHYVVPTSNGSAELWEASMVATHPDVLDDKRAILTYNNEGDAIALKRLESQAYNTQTNNV